MNIEKRLKQYLDLHNVQAPDVYKHVGVGRATWSGWVNSGKGIPLNKLQMILELFPELDARWLITGKTEASTIASRQTAHKGPDVLTDTAADYLILNEEIERLKENNTLLQEINRQKDKNIRLLENLIPSSSHEPSNTITPDSQ